MGNSNITCQHSGWSSSPTCQIQGKQVLPLLAFILVYLQTYGHYEIIYEKEDKVQGCYDLLVVQKTVLTVSLQSLYTVRQR